MIANRLFLVSAAVLLTISSSAVIAQTEQATLAQPAAVVPLQSSAVKEGPSGSLVYSSFIGRHSSPLENGDGYRLFEWHIPGGTTPKQLTFWQDKDKGNLGAAVWYPVWSPNGKFVLFLALPAPGNVDIEFFEAPDRYRLGLNLYVLNVDTGAVKRLSDDGGAYYDFCWSPDSKTVIGLEVDRPVSTLYAWDVASGARRVLLTSNGDRQITEPVVSLDSQSVLFHWLSSKGLGGSLFSIPIAGGKPKLVMAGDAKRRNYSPSPTGKHMFYVEDDVAYMADADGKHPTLLARSVGFKHDNWVRALWAQDGEKLMFVEDIRAEVRFEHKVIVYLYDLKAKKLTQLVTLPGHFEFAHASSDFQWLVLGLGEYVQLEKPDSVTGSYIRDTCRVVAVSVNDGHSVALAQMEGMCKGADWVEAH